MKISKYTFLFDVENREFYTYNTLSNSLIEIDESDYAVLKQAKKNKSDINMEQFEQEFTDILIANNIVTETPVDDFLVYKSIIETQRSDRSGMHLTIAYGSDSCDKKSPVRGNYTQLLDAR